MKIYGVMGRRNGGETALVEQLVTEIAERGFTVSAINQVRDIFEIDHEGRDSHRHRTAGAQEVLVASNARWALIHELRHEAEPSLDALIAKLSPCDLVVIEGHGRGGHPKIEIHRSGAGEQLIARDDPTITMIATDAPLGIDRRQIDLDDVGGIADFILAETGLA